MRNYAQLAVFTGVAIVKAEIKHHGEHQRIRRKYQPDGLPVFHPIHGEIIYRRAAQYRSEISTDTVNGRHKQPLRAGADISTYLLFDKHRTGDVEEVERATVDQH